MMELSAYLRKVGWSGADLAKQAKISKITAGRALSGQQIRSSTARTIAAALSVALEQKILPGDIDDLQIQHSSRKEVIAQGE